LEVLGKRRWAVVYPSDIRAAYSDLEEASKLGHRDAQKILGKFVNPANFQNSLYFSIFLSIWRKPMEH
jgi:hypothetical protein